MLVKLIQVHNQLLVDLLIWVSVRELPDDVAEALHSILLESLQLAPRLLVRVQLPHDLADKAMYRLVREAVYRIMLDSLFAYQR